MKNLIFLVIAATCLTGCRTIQKLYKAESHTAEPSSIPDVYEITGVTANDYQWVQPVRCADSLVRVWVKRPGETEFRECNKYEIKVSTIGTGGGSFWFKREANPTFDSDGTLLRLVIKPYPVAPTGTEYRVQSMLVTGSSSSELY